MQKLQIQGVRHITLVGADRQTSIDFWEGVLGMPFERGDYNIAPAHLADAIETLVRRSRASLSDDRSPKHPYEQ